MKSFKIGQNVEKSLYPIELRLEELKKSEKESRIRLASVCVPAIVSALLTAAVSEKLLSVNPAKPAFAYNWYEKTVTNRFGALAVCLLLFILLTLAGYGLIRLIRLIADRKKCGNVQSGDVYAALFYKIIIPEIITGAGMFEKAYEIECGNIDAEELSDGTIAPAALNVEEITLEEIPTKNINRKAMMYYYEALYHFRSIIPDLETIIYSEDAENADPVERFRRIGQDAVMTALLTCRHCVNEICKRTEDAHEEEMIEAYGEFLRTVSEKK